MDSVVASCRLRAISDSGQRQRQRSVHSGSLQTNSASKATENLEATSKFVPQSSWASRPNLRRGMRTPTSFSNAQLHPEHTHTAQIVGLLCVRGGRREVLRPQRLQVTPTAPLLLPVHQHASASSRPKARAAEAHVGTTRRLQCVPAWPPLRSGLRVQQRAVFQAFCGRGDGSWTRRFSPSP